MVFRIIKYQPRQLTTKMTPRLALILALMLPCALIASDNDQKKKCPLFSSSEALELVIQMDMHKVLNDKSEEPEYSPALLIHNISDKHIQTFNIKIRARGKTRRIADICEFPPLKINFAKKSTVNTVFEGQDKIKMVTHCNESEDYQNFAMLEYLSYKTYNTLTENSYRVRLVNVTYRDIRQKYPDITKSGFLIEDDELMAERIRGKISEKKIWSSDSCDQKAVDIFSVFQFMIGNTDWWIHTRHNVDLVSLEDDKLVPIPFDFDGAGLLNTPYAVPSPQLPILNVRDRYFKNECFTTNYDHYEEIVSLFNSRRAAISQMIDEADFLDKKYRRSTMRYVDDFYEIINNEADFTKYIIQNCDHMNRVPDRAPKRKNVRQLSTHSGGTSQD